MRFKIVAVLLVVAVFADVGVTILTRRAEAVESKLPAADPGVAQRAHVPGGERHSFRSGASRPPMKVVVRCKLAS